MKNVKTMVSRLIFSVVIMSGFFSLIQAAALNNGLALTPPMGWNSWNVFHENINETQIKQIADAMVSSGMRDAGYIYLNLDDNWMATSRDSNGNLRADPTRFPSGMKALGDYIHSKGLKFGIYGDRGTMTCAGVPQSGSYGNEQRDANSFASWGVDYLKYDNCNPVGDQQTAYVNMKNALASCGRPIVFSICAWQFQSWMPSTGNLWRVSDDIVDRWDNGTSWGKGIIECIDDNRNLASYAGPGGWNDPDMLEIGNGGCTTEEYRTQMSMWCIMAAPLLAGNDIRNMNQTTRDILLNTEAIAVNQDPAGIQGTRISSNNGLEVWSKPLGTANGTTKAVALLNRNGSSSSITVDFASIGLSGTVTVRDLWAKVDRGSFTGSYTMTVPSHGTGMLKLSSGPPATPAPTTVPQQEPIWSGGPYTLNGSSDYVDLPDNITTDLQDFSIACRVNLNSIPDWVRIFDFGGDTNIFMMLTPASGTTGNPYFCITLTGNDGEQGLNGPSALPTGSDQHFAITKSGNTAIFYINGQEVDRNNNMTLKPADMGNTTNNYIGRSQWTNDPYLSGVVDDFVLYNRAISPSEVADLANPPEITIQPTDTPTPTPTPTPTTPPGECNVFFNPNNSTQGVNSSFRIDVMVDSGNQELSAYGFTITYNETILEVVEVEEGSEGFVSAANTLNPGEIIVSGFDTSGTGPGSDLQVLVITFNAIAEGTSPLGLFVDKLVDGGTNTIGTACGIDGSVEVTTALRGDTNGDGAIDIVDALLIAQYYVDLDPSPFIAGNADTNCDGSIDIIDALLVAQYYVELISQFC
ncbi:MAG: alpha-galactosidase [Spirochaetales bacterium]|nr:alpha-galactosidase [Spirochaetales bacterium]